MKKIITLILVAVMMIGFAVMVNAERTTVYATKVDKAPNMENETPFIDESWGEPAIVINSSSPNTELYKFWYKENPHIGEDLWTAHSHISAGLEPEDGDVELYYLWDNKYLYFGMKTPDTEPSGFTFPYMGDGVQMWLAPFEIMRGNEYVMSSYEQGEVDAVYDANSKYDFSVTLDMDDYSSHSGGGATELDCNAWVDEDGYLYVYIAIPLTEVGLNPKQNLHGARLATALLRVSSRCPDDRGYSGWLAWGRFFMETKVDQLNEVILVDPAQGSIGGETEAPATEAPATEAPATEAPATEAPATEAPATEAPATEAPATEAPATEAPATEAPATEAPATEAPATEAPATEAPATEAPATEAPATEAPTTEAPATEAPATEAPATEAPATEAPKVEEPVEKNNTGLIIAIVAVVVVVGAGLGIVLGKKKK